MQIARKVVLGLLLGSILGGSLASAQESRSERQVDGLQLASAGRLVESIGVWLRNIWEKAGCRIDPLGRCIQEPDNPVVPPAGMSGTVVNSSGGGQASVKAGCRIDPFGRCVQITASPITVDSRAIVRPVTNRQGSGKEGCRLDPLGRCAKG